jgi:hypothetical protein
VKLIGEKGGFWCLIQIAIIVNVMMMMMMMEDEIREENQGYGIKKFSKKVLNTGFNEHSSLKFYLKTFSMIMFFLFYFW